MLLHADFLLLSQYTAQINPISFLSLILSLPYRPFFHFSLLFSLHFCFLLCPLLFPGKFKHISYLPGNATFHTTSFFEPGTRHREQFQAIPISFIWNREMELERGEWPSGLNSLRPVIEDKLGRVTQNSGWVTSEV